MNYIGIANNKSLIELFNKIKGGELILKPAFQRNLVWNDNHKENFIETILRGLPFPEIYLSEGDIDLNTQRTTKLVVDGQQRLNTIYRYIMGDKDLALKRVPRFKDLNSKQKTDFYDYQIVVRELGRIDDEKIKEIFKRINSIQYALNAVEINNALYEGEFISAAKDIATCPALQKLEIFNENQYARMKDLEFILTVMTTIEIEGYFTGIKEVESYIKKYDNAYSSSKNAKANIVKVLEFIEALKLSADSIWLRKSSFFTLIVELIKFRIRYSSLPKVGELASLLNELENKIMQYKNEDMNQNEYARYYYYVFQGTAGRVGRSARGAVLERMLRRLISIKKIPIKLTVKRK